MNHFGTAVLLFSLVACGDSGTSGTTGAGGGGDGGSTGSTTSTSSAGGSGGGGGAAATGCEAICDKNQEVDDVIMCAWMNAATCVADCDAYFVGLDAACVDEAEAYEECRIAQPETDFVCTPNDPDGSSTLSTTTCDAAFAALSACP